MDLLPLIESRRFLGREFLTWLWFESELFGGELSASSAGALEVAFERQITLVGGPKGDEESKLKGVNPSATSEAREALRQGKLPTVARARLRKGERDFAFVFNADTLGLASLKLPDVVKEGGDEPFFDRVALVEEIESALGALYADFLRLRAGEVWGEVVLPAIMRWVRDEPEPAVELYSAARDRALSGARARPVASTRGKATKRAA
ncbi:MAG TPA: hypothetical protein VFS43_15965 [Polyangiaceae bacterium]|nr:hypothetical protein [Polyangiaceae bacterium]